MSNDAVSGADCARLGLGTIDSGLSSLLEENGESGTGVSTAGSCMVSSGISISPRWRLIGSSSGCREVESSLLPSFASSSVGGFTSDKSEY